MNQQDDTHRLFSKERGRRRPPISADCNSRTKTCFAGDQDPRRGGRKGARDRGMLDKVGVVALGVCGGGGVFIKTEFKGS